MAAILVKRRLWIVASLLALALSVAAILCVFAGTRIASANLVASLEDFTGRRLVYSGEPFIRVFPALSAELKSVAFYAVEPAANAKTVLEVPAMQLSLSLLAALKGDVRITGVVLEQPVFRAKAQDNSWQSPLSADARLTKLVAEITAALPSELGSDEITAARDSAMGVITIKDGTIVLSASDSAAHTINDRITKIDGALNWPVSSSEASFKVSFVWRGELAKLEAATDDLVLLAAGVETGISFTLDAKPLTSRFTGKVRLQPAPYIEGILYSEANPLSGASQWLGVEMPDELMAMGMTLNGALKGDSEQWQLEDTQLQLGTNKGTGGLIFQPHMAAPMLSGTLDFESLDLAILTRIFEPDLQAKNSKPQASFATDMRISANTATFGALALNKVAASLQISDQASTLDIHDASAFGGTLQMAIKSQSSPNPETELRILANGIETKALETLGGPITGLPQARGSLSAILRGPSASVSQFLETASGTIKLRLGAGTIPGINANQMIARLRQGGFFSLAAEAPSAWSFTDLSADAKLENGTMQFDPLKVGLDKANLELKGTYAVKDQSLALTGQLNLEAGHAEALNNAETITVFFGGNRNAPLMSAIRDIPIKK